MEGAALTNPDEMNRFAPPKAEVAEPAVTPGDVAPALWNPNAVASWSLVFTPIFGALVHRQNWLALGDAKRAEASRNWAIAYVALLVASGIAGALMPARGSLEGLLRLLGFAALIAWYYAIGKPQVNLVRARFDGAYPRKGWGRPIGIALVALVGYFGLAFIVALMASGM
jgi:hypothetical protein